MRRPSRRRLSTLAGGCAALLISAARPADAQPQPAEGMYVSVGALADVKRFSGDPTTNVLDSQTFGGTVALGTSLATRWDLEIGVDVPRATSNSLPRYVTFQRETITLQSKTENRAMSVVTFIRYRMAPRARVQIGFLGGLSFVRLHRQFATEAPANTPSVLIPRSQTLVDYGAAPTVGVDARIAIAGHLCIVPAIHVSAFAFRDVSGVLVRPRIGVRWTF